MIQELNLLAIPVVVHKPCKQHLRSMRCTYMTTNVHPCVAIQDQEASAVLKTDHGFCPHTTALICPTRYLDHL